VANIYKSEIEILRSKGELTVEEFFKEIIERAHYYEKFELFREYERISQTELNTEE
jgi:hypothetical protein